MIAELVIELRETWFFAGRSHMAGEVLRVPEIDGLNLVAAGKAVLVETADRTQRQARILRPERVQAFVGRPGGRDGS